MRDDLLTTIAARVDPAGPGAYRGLARSSEGRQMLEAILATPRPARRPSRARLRRILAVPVAAAVVATVLLLAGDAGRTPRPSESRWAPSLVAMAEEAPRLLIGAEGWKVTGADELGRDEGETFFEDGRYSMSLNWNPAESYERYLQDRRRGAARSWEITIAGQEAKVFLHTGTAPVGATFYALWVDGEQWMELRTDVVPAFGEFRAIAGTLHAVDVDTWLSALPPSVVTPDERPDAVDEVLADVPVPSNVDVDALRNENRVNGSVGYEVATAVVCGWVGQWVDATRSGDEAARREAVEAMSGARRWNVFAERGQLASFVFDVVDAMKTGAPVNGDRSLPVGVGYQRHLGCAES